MQVKIKQEPKVFKPVTLEITFETEKELKVFQNMCSYDIDVPDLVYPCNREDNQNLKMLLGAIYDMMVENQGGQHLSKTKHNYTAVPTAQIPEQDYFYYVTDEDKEEVLEILVYHQKNFSEEDIRVSKYW